jgi:cytolysin-activating lysine-acyltransferase
MSSPLNDVQINAPAFAHELGSMHCTLSRAEALGSIVWLWMHSEMHSAETVQGLSSMLLAPLHNDQYILGLQAGKPIFFASWARFSLEAEQKYIASSGGFIDGQAWLSGDRLWFLDWVAPFGHTKLLKKTLNERCFPHTCGRFLYHKGDKTGLKIKQCSGAKVSKTQAEAWFRSHPLIN